NKAAPSRRPPNKAAPKAPHSKQSGAKPPPSKQSGAKPPHSKVGLRVFDSHRKSDILNPLIDDPGEVNPSCVFVS
ncbi:MAG: hypothetical protein M3R67_08585, partial [Acidobacteriota bacterium]|nr:hypothetical protein [Acidobacteriota bacterium]